MTQTVSFRDRLQKGFTVFKWELRNCSGALLIFSILAAVFAAIILTLCLAVGYMEATDELTKTVNYEDIRNSVIAFQLISSNVIFYMNAVFTIIYTVRIYSYLHNKRKADMYGALPIGRRTFFVAKTVSAYLLSVVPTLFFLGLIALISVCFGQPLLNETAGIYVRLLLGSIASISFYALLAVCCGTTVNAVLCFAAVNIAYPVATLFIKGTIKAFFYGMPTNLYNNSFIMKALNPLAAYDGTNIIYWLIFTAACLALGIWLVKKRRAECAQTSFAYYLPAYIVKLLVAFIIGMFLGTVFGSLNVFGFPLIGFIFGFHLGSIPAYLIAHLIFYRGLNKFPRTLIAFGTMSAAAIFTVLFCFFDFFGYNSFVPAADSVKSAGVVDLGDCYFTGKTGIMNIGKMASDDYDDAESIKAVQTYHRSVIAHYNREGTNRFARVWENMFTSNFGIELFSDDYYVVSYKLSNGRTVMRSYSNSDGFFDNSYDRVGINTSAVYELLCSDEYFDNYSAVMNARYDEITNLALDRSAHSSGYLPYEYYRTGIQIRENEGKVSAAKAAADRKKVLDAFRSDSKRLTGEEHKAPETAGKGTPEDNLIENALYLHLSYALAEPDTGSPLTDLISALESGSDGNTETGKITSEHTETLKALREIGVLTADNEINRNSDYCFE